MPSGAGSRRRKGYRHHLRASRPVRDRQNLSFVIRPFENFFCSLKEFRRIATRYDKTDISFAAAIHLVGAFFALK